MENKDKKNVALRIETDGMRYMMNKDKIKSLEDRNKYLSTEIIEGLNDLGTKSYSFTADDEDGKTAKYTFTKAEKTKISYDNEKVKEVIGKKLYSQIIDRELIADWNKMVDLAKKYNIPKEEILECLTINESINNNKLKEMYEVGTIDIKKLKGTFTIDSNEYLMVRKS